MSDERDTQPEATSGQPWFWTEELDEDVVLVTVIGDITASRARDLWSNLENVLELAPDRLVIADLTGVTAFDVYSMKALSCVARACVRRRSQLRALMRSNSSLARHAQSCGLTRRLPVYPSLTEALADA
jgi:anti-anti-sigma factor